MRRALGVAWTTIVVVALLGCSATMRSAEVPTLDNTAWVLATVGGKPPAGNAPTARFEGDRLFGTDGCNRYTATYSTKGAAITIDPRGAATMMACPPDLMKQAEAFTAALSAAKSYRISEGRLQLLAADGTALAVFAPQSQTLAGTSWRATGINTGKGSVASVVAGTSVTIVFSADGKVSGFAGCNTFAAGYLAEGGALQFTPAAATRKMCAAPDVMEQEQAFFNALASVTTMRMEADQLELRTAAGALALVFARTPKS